ncbi:MAG: hypothetical protein HRU38_01890 [Saccharospirillaceae bacterium]|nr:hypothetical protein [Pseudomonadales bacterium]NRB77410.1 hypothetical protein [Saccharospirillaceae bacterium]
MLGLIVAVFVGWIVGEESAVRAGELLRNVITGRVGFGYLWLICMGVDF